MNYLIKIILNKIPRKYLIKLSIFLKPFLKILYKGSKYIDPIDNSSYRKFLPYGYNKIRENALCPGTFSLERHRLLWLYLKNETDYFKKKSKVLHIAPEQIFYKKFNSFKNWDYTTLDLFSPLAKIKADICNMPFTNDKFDLIICNHVLEHVVDDKKALSEIYRVLKRGGCAILQVPINESIEKSKENKGFMTRGQRTKEFGQYDHIRSYGNDFYELLKSVGFIVKATDYLKKIDYNLKIKYCLPKNEKIPIAYKA